MAKTSAIERNKKRERMVKQQAARRSRLKDAACDESLPLEERFAARLKLAELPRNSSPVRIRNRCSLSGRPRGFKRKYGVSRLTFRELALAGKIPGVVKSSW